MSAGATARGGKVDALLQITVREILESGVS